MSIYDRIQAGEFRSILKRPEKVKCPDLFTTPAGSLSDEELAAIPAAKRRYAEDIAAYHESMRRCDESEKIKADKFVDALFEEHGVPKDEFGMTMYSLAYQNGHAGGEHEIAGLFEELMPLYRLYAAK